MGRKKRGILTPRRQSPVVQDKRFKKDLEPYVIPPVWLKRIIMTTYITKGAPLLLESPLIRTLQLSVPAVKKSYDE